VYTEEVFANFTKRKRRGRPPRLGRDHLKALFRILRTLVDDLDNCLDYLLPTVDQVDCILGAIEYLSAAKKKYIKRIKYTLDGGPIPENEVVAEEKEDE